MTMQSLHAMGMHEAAIYEKWRDARARLELKQQAIASDKCNRTMAEVDAEARKLSQRLDELNAERMVIRGGQPRIEDIQSAVCFFYDMNKVDLLSKRKFEGMVRPRQIAQFLAKTLTTKSLPEIARAFGGRDHTTILHSVRMVERRLRVSDALAAEIEEVANISLGYIRCSSPPTTAR